MTIVERLAALGTEERAWEDFFVHCEQYVDSCHRGGFPEHARCITASLAVTCPHRKARILHAVTLGICGYPREAIALLESTVQENPDLLLNPGFVEYNTALWRLTLGDYSAWGGYEQGHLVNVRPKRLGAPSWEGDYMGPDKTLCIWGEQGAGDVFMFLRFVEDAAERSGARIILEVDPTLTEVLRSSPIVTRVGALVAILEAETSVISHDAQVSIVSLPYRLGYTTVEPLAYRGPYMAPRPQWAERAGEILRDGHGLDHGKPWVGIAWNGGTAHSNNARRSIGLDAVRPLLEQDCVHWVNLQQGVECSGVAADVGPALEFWSQTAAFVSQLDLVVACDTSVAHLAGAMGVPVMLMIPRAPCWRWGLEGSETAWYGRTTIYRQSEPGDWPGVVERVVLDIEQFAGAWRGRHERAASG